MKRIILTSIFLLNLIGVSFAWDLNTPADDIYKYLIPGEIRQLKADIQALTDAALQITNNKVASNAAIADTKLATISTAGKVLGSAFATLSGIPIAAGLIPIANIPVITAAKGGTNADSSASTGMPKVTAGAWTFNATQDDLGSGSTYKQYNPAAVAITGGSISGSTISVENRTSDPATPATGQIWIRTDL